MRVRSPWTCSSCRPSAAATHKPDPKDPRMPDPMRAGNSAVTPLPAPAHSSSPAAAASEPTRAGRRKRLFGFLAAVVIVAAVGIGIWLWLTANEVSTDNAYVDADLVQVTPLYGGPIAKIAVSNTDMVKQGQVLL